MKTDYSCVAGTPLGSFCFLPARCSRRWMPWVAGMVMWLCVVGVWSAPAIADPAQMRVLELRIERLERLLDGQTLTVLAQTVGELQVEVRQLRGQVERLEYDLEQLRTRQRDQFRDLDERFGQNERATDPRQSSALGDTTATLPVEERLGQDEQSAYEIAFDRLMAGEYPAAIREFERFVERFPASPFQPNALYWLAEAKYAQQEYDAALQIFTVVRERFPETDKAADALLKIGFAQFELGRRAEARATLETVLREYPGTTLARLAQDRLRRMDAR